MLKADLKQNIEFVIDQFKREVNPKFIVTKADLSNIIKLLNETNLGWSNHNGGDVLYKYIDMDVLKNNNVKSFNFTIEQYNKWIEEEWYRLKRACKERRNKSRGIH